MTTNVKDILNLMVSRLSGDTSDIQAQIALLSNKKIIDLDAIVTQSSNDIYEASANGTGSFKETRTQMLNYIDANAQISSTAQVTGLDDDLSDISTDITALQSTKMDKSANLSDVSNVSESTGNLGLGTAGLGVLTSNTVLTNPCSRKYVLNSSTPFNVNLPSAQSSPGAPAIQVGWQLEFENRGTATVTVKDESGSTLGTIDYLENKLFILSGNGTPAGLWIIDDNFSTPAVREQFTGINGINYDSSTGNIGLISLTQGQLIGGTSTDAQPITVNSPDGTVAIDTSTDGQIKISAWPAVENGVQAGTNLTKVVDSGAKTVTLNAAGTPFNVGGGASFAISSGATTSFSNSSYVPLNCTVATSSATNMTVNSDGSITCNSAGTYGFAYVLSARSSSSQNVFYFAIAKNSSVDTTTLQPIYVPGATSTSGSTVVVAGKFSLVSGDIVQLYISNGQTLSNSLIAQTMVGTCTQDLASSATLQSAYANGNTIQGDLNANPVQVINNSSVIVASFNNAFADFPKNYGNWTPAFSNLSGVSGSITVNSARFVRQSNGIMCFIDASLTVNNSAVSFDVSLPVSASFTNSTQANYVGGNVFAVPPTVADGNVVSYVSNNTDQTVTITLNATTGSGSFNINLCYLYEVQ